MLFQSLPESVGHFWQPSELKNLENPNLEQLKHLQNLGHYQEQILSG